MVSNKIICIGLSHAGYVRDHNEDSWIADSENQICIVADGVGGSQAGEVASSFVTKRLYASLNNNEEEITIQSLTPLLRSINSELLDLAKSNYGYKGMGSTLVFIIKQSETILVGNIGDSRAYLLRNGALRQITKDHSVVQEMLDMNTITPQEAFDHPMKHYLTMAMGNASINPDIFEMEMQDNDILMLCSDGLTDMVTDTEIESILTKEKSIDKGLIALRDKALNNGGVDNISIILAAI
jgi:PPM family protein phosphatase